MWANELYILLLLGLSRAHTPGCSVIVYIDTELARSMAVFMVLLRMFRLTSFRKKVLRETPDPVWLITHYKFR